MHCATMLLTWIYLMPAVQPGDIQHVANVEFKGTIQSPTDLSAVTVVGNWLVVGSDETTSIQVMKPQGDRAFQADEPIPLLNDGDQDEKEIDIEGITSDDKYVYVVGSHCLARKKLDDGKSRLKNLERLSEIKAGKNRHALFRLKLKNDGHLDGIPEVIKLNELLEQHEVLGRFSKIPSKENGIDIEGIATDGERLFVGFRGPVLTGNWVPVVAFKFAEPRLDKSDTFYLPLDGLGIRDLVHVSNGFLVLAGPVGDGPSVAELYWWNGKDCIPDEGHAEGHVLHLGHIDPPVRDAKAEGMTVLKFQDKHYEIMILYDGPTNGSADVFRVPAP